MLLEARTNAEGRYVGGYGQWLGSAYAAMLVTMRSLLHANLDALSHDSHWAGERAPYCCSPPAPGRQLGLLPPLPGISVPL